MNVMDLNLSDYEQIAYASSDRPGQMRWTTLAVYWRANGGDQAAVAIVEGGTRVLGEEQRESRRAAATISEATRLFEVSKLRDQAMGQILDWMAKRIEAVS